jgi:hypothetical protein
MGVGPVVFVAAMLAVLAAVGVKVLADTLRDRPVRTLPQELADRLEWQVWNPTGRLCRAGLTWPEHNYDIEYCGCPSCHDYEIGELEDTAVDSAFLGIVAAERARERAQ